jgi:hypothetical protein
MYYMDSATDTETKLARKSFFVAPGALRRAKRALGVKSDAEAVRLALEWIARSEEHWRLLKKTSGKLRRGSFRRP